MKALNLALHAGGFDGEPDPPRTRVKHAVQQARKHLNEHFTDNTSLVELSALVGLSPYGLVRAFSADIGMPPHAYQTQLRIMRAKRLMLTGMPLSEIASRNGFTDQSHFGRHFRKLINTAPRLYLQSCKNVLDARPTDPLAFGFEDYP